MQHQSPGRTVTNSEDFVLRLRDFRRAPRAAALALCAGALFVSGCADQEASYVGARSIDPAHQSGLGNPDRDRPVIITPSVDAQDQGQRYQWNGNPQRIIEGRAGAPGVPPPRLQPQPAPQATREQSAPPDAQMIEVQPGDTLHGIAERYGVTVASLNQANALSGAPLKPGQRLVLPPTAR